MKKLWLTTLLSLVPLAAQAQSPRPAMFGPGRQPCTVWSAAEAKADDADYKALRFFVAGVMSAYNVYVSAPLANVAAGQTPDDMKAFMHGWCAAHPNDMIGDGAVAYLAKLKAAQR